MNTHVFLCHKCGGNLTDHAKEQLFSCTCMSGYVRDWQQPVALDQAIIEQRAAWEQRLALFQRQGRSELEIELLTPTLYRKAS